MRVYVTLHNAQTLLGKPDIVGRIDIRLVDADAAPAVHGDRSSACSATTPRAGRRRTPTSSRLFAMQNTIISFVVGAILAVGGFGILAIQIMIVLQKTRDIAILRSVGFRRADILAAFLLQGAIIALVGAAVGDLAGHYVLVALSHLKTHTEGLVKSRDLPRLRRPALLLVRRRLRARRRPRRQRDPGAARLARRAGRRAPGAARMSEQKLLPRAGAHDEAPSSSRPAFARATTPWPPAGGVVLEARGLGRELGEMKTRVLARRRPRRSTRASS